MSILSYLNKMIHYNVCRGSGDDYVEKRIIYGNEGWPYPLTWVIRSNEEHISSLATVTPANIICRTIHILLIYIIMYNPHPWHKLLDHLFLCREISQWEPHCWRESNCTGLGVIHQNRSIIVPCCLRPIPPLGIIFSQHTEPVACLTTEHIHNIITSTQDIDNNETNSSLR